MNTQATWTRVPERGSFRMMRLGIAIMNFCGYRLSLVAGFFATAYFYLTGKTSREASRIYLRRLREYAPEAGVRPTWRAVFRHHWHFAVSVMDRMWFWQGKLDSFSFTREGREHIANRTSGILLMGSHLGSFDALRAFSKEKNLKLNVVMYRGHAQNINKLLDMLNPEAEIQVVELDEGSVDQVFVLKERLDAGEVVAILGDRPAPHGRKRQAYLPFLGRPAPFPQNPWILASLLECPVYFTVGLRLGPRRYHVMVEPLADRVVLPRKTREEALHTYMERYVHRLESLCAAHPFEWFNFFDFWPDPPEPARGSA